MRRETPAYARELAAMGGAVADCSASMTAYLPRRPRPLSPNIPDNRRASLEMEQIRLDRRTGEPVYACLGVLLHG